MMAVLISGDGMWIFAFNLGCNHPGKCENVCVMELMSKGKCNSEKALWITVLRFLICFHLLNIEIKKYFTGSSWNLRQKGI